MAEETPNSLTVPPGVPILGGAKITGAATILAIMLFGAVVWIYKENEKREVQIGRIYEKLDYQDKVRGEQFERMACRIDVAVFVHSFPKGGIDWSLLPADMYTCLPNFKLK